MYISNNGLIDIGFNFKANSGERYNPIGGDTKLRLVVNKNAILKIGNNVGISNSTIVCCNFIQIGDKVLFGGSCKIYDTDFHSLDYKNRLAPYINGVEDSDVKNAPIIIKEGTWIGGHSIILKGVTIGERSIIGAGSIVTKDIPNDEIWGGNPAKLIRKIKNN